MLDAQEIIKMFVTMFIVVNPVGAAPLFLSLTSRSTSLECNRIAWRAGLTTALLLLGTLLVGSWVLQLFSISVASFRVIGGILLLLMGLDMLGAKPRSAKITAEEETEAEGRDDPAIVPLGTPMLAGPGAISTVILYSHSFSHDPATWVRFITLVACILGVGILSWLTLRVAGPIGRILGNTGVNVLTRLMGVVMGAIAVEYMVAGLKELLPILSRPPA